MLTSDKNHSQKIFLLIDGHALIYRSYFAFPKQLTDPEGRLMNAVYGFTRSILTAIRQFEPTYMAVTFDHKKPSFRKEVYEEYKANRPSMPEELRPQIEVIKEVVDALNIPKYEVEGLEADDLIGTISFRIEDIGGLTTVIVTGDQDTFQLVDDNTHVWLPGRGKKPAREYDAAAVEDKIGVGPEKIIDLKALMGDSSDNIPGIRGVGPKTGVKLIKEFGNIEKLYEFVDNDKEHPLLKGSLLEKLKKDKQNAFLSKKLATIAVAAPLKFNLKSCIVKDYDKARAVEIFRKLDFKSLIELLPDDQFEQSIQEALF